jgi:hypothetical protein
MSEPCSFFLRVSIEKPQYLAFMQAKPSQPLIDDGWLKWWESRRMCNKSELAGDIRAFGGASNQDIVGDWLNAEGALAFSEFDEAANMWEFGIIMCAENDAAILPLLVFCESIFPYKRPSPDDFAIIYPYFWGDSYVMAYMAFVQEGMALSLAESVADVDKNHLGYAAMRLGEKWKVFEANMQYD